MEGVLARDIKDASSVALIVQRGKISTAQSVRGIFFTVKRFSAMTARGKHIHNMNTIEILFKGADHFPCGHCGGSRVVKKLVACRKCVSGTGKNCVVCGGDKVWHEEVPCRVCRK